MLFKNNKADKQQAARLEAERQRAQKEADQLKLENQRKQDVSRRRLMGRSSLINTSELGVQDKLG